MKRESKPAKPKIHPTRLELLGMFIRGSKRHFALSIALNAVAVAISFVTPLLVGYIVDYVTYLKTGADKPVNRTIELIIGATQRVFGTSSVLLTGAIAVCVCAVFAAVITFLYRRILATASETFVKTARDTLFDHVQRLPFKWHTEHQTGDIIQRCTSDVETTRNFITNQLVTILRTIIMMVAAMYILFTINVPLAVVVAAFIPVIVVYSYFFSKKLAKQFLELDNAEGALTINVQENLTGVRVIRAFGREKHETEKFDGLNDKYSDIWVRYGKTMSLFWSVGDAASAANLLVVVAVGAIFAARGSISIGDMLVFITCTQQIMWPVRQMGRTLSEMTKASVSLKRLGEILGAEAETEPETALKPPMNGDIVFNDVSFEYTPSQVAAQEGEAETETRVPHDVIRHLNLTVKGGTTLGILGATGSGKSTLTYLLTRLFDVPDGGGSITVGGVDVRAINRHYLRENIGLVLQEPFLFSKTIAENIAITEDGETDTDRVRAKARVASIDDDIAAFEHGYETKIGERGVTLSGGQKQRVAIARTLMKESPVMIFDDSMSALDMETDRRIRDGLRAATGTATVIIISHRVATLMTADNIAVLEDGHISEFGTHAELLALGGHYRRVYDIQSSIDS
ncbi:MAG: ABC transporter ATP-binding protein/permease [Oscillospiraceae bacterium]|jgi:ATP-binding cassette subfamily B protein|nr:ABC transporter ATP-binding protein/permease [Oscillospiraceae bacterium]